MLRCIWASDPLAAIDGAAGRSSLPRSSSNVSGFLSVLWQNEFWATLHKNGQDHDRGEFSRQINDKNDKNDNNDKKFKWYKSSPLRRGSSLFIIAHACAMIAHEKFFLWKILICQSNHGMDFLSFKDSIPFEFFYRYYRYIVFIVR